VIFSADATGAWPLSFQWQFAGTNLPGATSRVLILDEAMDEGDYQVVVSNALGVATSSVARLSFIDRPPLIRVQPASQIAYLSSTLNLQVAAEGSIPFSYQWRFNGADLPQATNATLSLPHLVISQSGAYAVTVSNAYGVVSSATAVVQLVNVVALGDDYAGEIEVPSGLVGVVQVAAGDYHSLALRADGTVVAWGGGVPGKFNFGQTIVPADLTNAVAIAAGGFHSLALRADGTVTAWGRNVGPIQYDRPEPAVQLYGQARVPAGLTEVVAIAAGEYYSVALRADGHVVVWGGGPQGPTNVPTAVRDIVAVAACPQSIMAIGAAGPIMLWGAEIPVPAGSDFVAIAPWVGLLADGTVSTVTPISRGALHGLAAFEVAGSGNQILARASDGTVVVLVGDQRTLSTSLLTNAVAIACGPHHSLVAFGDGSLQITAQPSNRKVELGGNTLLRVVAAGAPPLGFQWQLDGADLPGATNFWLRLTNVQFSDAGAYTVVVSNPSQSLTSQVAMLSVRLYTTNPPVITQQPISQMASMQTNILLTLAASGAPPLSYQWLKNGTDLPGATDALLAITNSTRHDSGIYAVAVSNPGGTTLSSNARVRVVVPQELGPAAWLSQGAFALLSRDADGAPLEPADLAGFEVETSSNLIDWMPLTNSLTLTSGALLLIDLEATNFPRRFYRILEK